MKTFKERLVDKMPPIRMEGFGDMEPAVREALVNAYEIGARAALELAAEECLEAEREHERHSKAVSTEAKEKMALYQEEDGRLAERLRTRAKELSDG